MTVENNHKSSGVNKSVIQSVTNINEVLKKYGERAKIHEIDFSQLLSLLDCCRNCLAITSGPSCLLSQTGQCIIRHEFNLEMLHAREKIQTKYSQNHNIILVSTDDILSEKKLGKSLHFFDQDGSLIHRIFIYTYENLTMFETTLAKLKTKDATKTADKSLINISKKKVEEQAILNFQRDWFSLSFDDHINTMIDYGANFRATILKDLPSNCSRKFSFGYLVKLIHLMHDAEVPLLKFSVRPGFAQASEDIVRTILPLSSITMLYGEHSCFALDERKVKSCRVSYFGGDNGKRSIIEIFDSNQNIVGVFLCGTSCNNIQQDLWEQYVSSIPRYH